MTTRKLPAPPAWLATLAQPEARQWRSISDAALQADPANIRRALATFGQASGDLRANAEWILARAEASRDDTPMSSRRLAELAARYPDVVTESGTPLSDLALLLALQRTPAGKLPGSLIRDLRQRVAGYPSFLTPALVDEAVRKAPGEPAVATLDARWRASERTLALMRRLPIDDLPADEIGLDEGDNRWIAFVADLPPAETAAVENTGPTCHVTLVPASVVESAFRSAIKDTTSALPPYASIALRLGDKIWRTSEPQAAATGPDELASAEGRFELALEVPSDTVPSFADELIRLSPHALPSGSLPEGRLRLKAPSAAHPYVVSVELADPGALYASYRRRFWLAMGLILAATVAALGGLAGTWQAFERQRRLGEMKSNFVASVSHELRAPIAAVRLMTESLERGTVEAPRAAAGVPSASSARSAAGSRRSSRTSSTSPASTRGTPRVHLRARRSPTRSSRRRSSSCGPTPPSGRSASCSRRCPARRVLQPARRSARPSSRRW